MIEVDLHNGEGQVLTQVKIHKTTEVPDGIMWGDVLFVYDQKKNIYRQGFILPAIIKKSNKK